MYNKENFIVAKVASKNHSRYNLHGIYCHSKFTVGCDGSTLMIITTPRADIKEMPVPAGGDELIDEFEPFVLDLDSAKRVEGSIPKKSSIPILSNVAVMKFDDVNVTFFSTNLQTQNITVCRKIDGEYPEFKKVLPKDKPIKTVKLQTKLLKNLISAIENAQGECRMPYIDLQIYNNEMGLDNNEMGLIGLRSINTNTGQEITAVLMAMKKDEKNKL